MRWFKIPRPRIPQPDRGSYRDWKERLAAEGNHQCVYCAIHESSWGGTRNFHVEHFRPKCKFRDLENKIDNLFYACSVCNSFKGNDWLEPDPSLSSACYPEPSLVNYNDIISIDDRGYLSGQNAASRYIIEKLYLNRPQLLLERRHAALAERLSSVISRLRQGLDAVRHSVVEVPPNAALRLSEAVLTALALQVELRSVRPYTPDNLVRH
jgi:hypothetical protein